MKRFSLCLVVVIVLAACGSSPRADTTPTPRPAALPQHIIASDGKTFNGRRIEIRVANADLTKDECKALIAAYRERAKPEGQVSVRKPAPDGSLQPWCVDNLDERGVFFNDAFFK